MWMQSVSICLHGSAPGHRAGWNLCLLWVTLCIRSLMAARNRFLGQKSCPWEVKQ